MKKASQMSNFEVLDYFDLIDDETEEDLEDFEYLEFEAEDGRLQTLTIDDLRQAIDDGKVLTDLMIVDYAPPKGRFL